MTQRAGSLVTLPLAVLAFWRRQTDEIVEDPALRVYSVALCICHLLAFAFWQQTSLPRVLSTGTPVCWPFFESCGELTRQSYGFWQLALMLYAIVATLSTLLLRGARARWGVAGVVILFVLHLKELTAVSLFCGAETPQRP
jgi:hypothetical protein